MMSQLQNFQGSNGYLFASPEVHFDVVEGRAAGNVWVPWYTMHKVLAGVVDVYEFTRNATALEVASSLGDWVYHSHRSR